MKTYEISTGKTYKKRTPAAICVSNPKVSVVCSYDFTGDRKPKTEMAFGIPGFISPVKALKNMFFVSIGNARTVIGHREKILMISDRKSKVDMSACRSIADGILNENREYLPDAHFIAGIRRKRFFREGNGHGDRFSGGKRLKSFEGIKQQSVQFGSASGKYKLPAV